MVSSATHPATSGRPAPPHAADVGGSTARWGGPATTVLVATLTLFALWIRVDGLTGWDGTLSVDEARLALAARGILATGLPQLPSGWVYTRGLPATYLTAAIFAVAGDSDVAARLAAVLTGTALIPVAFLLGREVAGRVGGLFVAAFLAGHPSFVVWSRQAWFYAPYLLLYALTLLFMLRAARTGRGREYLATAMLLILTAAAHEVGAFLALPFGVTLARRLWQDRRCRDRWPVPVASVLIVAIGGLLLWSAVSSLRAESLVGAYGEVDEYLSPSVEWPRIRFYLRLLLDGPGLLLAGAIAGAVAAMRRRRIQTLVLWLALLPALAHAAFLIPRGPQERYGLSLVLVLAVLAAEGVRMACDGVAAAVGRRRPFTAGASQLATRFVAGSGLAGLVLVGILGAHQDVARAIDRARLSPREGAWLRQAHTLGLGPADVIMTDVPTIVAWYIGGLDYWVSSRDFEKYTVRTDDVRRDVHTGAILVRNRADYERYVAGPMAGQTVWLIASGRSYQWGELVSDELKSLLDRQATERINPGDAARFLVLKPPPGS